MMIQKKHLEARMREINLAFNNEARDVRLHLRIAGGNRYNLCSGKRCILPNATKKNIDIFLNGFQHCINVSNLIDPLKSLDFIAEIRVFRS